MSFDASGSAPPPPVPQRPPPISGGYGMDPYNYGGSYMQQPFGSPYGMHSYGGYGGMYGGGMYGQYGGGMYGQPSAESNFVRLAEESSRNAFQSIESVVSAVASVANMLNSTHNAVFSSFRAVIGVVEQFSLLKKQMAAVLTFTLVRWLRAFWRRLMVFLRLKPANYAMASDAWTDVTTGKEPSFTISWPAMIFWMVALGGPYLIYKCVSQMVNRIEERRKWATGAAAHHSAKALYDFTASSNAELSFRRGDRLRVAPKDEQPKINGWLLAALENGEQMGLVPINYLKVMKQTTETPPRVGTPPTNGIHSSQSTVNEFENAYTQ